MSGEVEKCPILHVRPKFDVFTLCCRPIEFMCCVNLRCISSSISFNTGLCTHVNVGTFCSDMVQ